jgi:hypothetical protein
MSDHYYLPDGSPFYEVLGKNGKLRSVNIRDAKEVKAVPKRYHDPKHCCQTWLGKLDAGSGDPCRAHLTQER